MQRYICPCYEINLCVIIFTNADVVLPEDNAKEYGRQIPALHLFLLF